jgi:hypothetical protein
MEVHLPNQRRWCKALIFAPAGHGKTHLLGTAQEDERTFPMAFLDFESGYESLAGLDIDVFPIRSWRDADQIYEALLDGAVKKVGGEEIDFGEYRSVGIDSISEWHRWALLHRLDEQGPHRKNPDLLEQGDYGVAAVQMRRVLRKYRDLPMHVFYAAHAKQNELPREGRVTLPDMSGQMAEEVAGLVSVSGYLALSSDSDGEEERVLLLRNYPKFRIKARSPWGIELPDEIVDPTIGEILDVLGYEENGSRNGGKKKKRRK